MRRTTAIPLQNTRINVADIVCLTTAFPNTFSRKSWRPVGARSPLKSPEITKLLIVTGSPTASGSYNSSSLGASGTCNSTPKSDPSDGISNISDSAVTASTAGLGVGDLLAGVDEALFAGVFVGEGLADPLALGVGLEVTEGEGEELELGVTDGLDDGKS